MARTTLIDVQYDFVLPGPTNWEEVEKKTARMQSLWRQIPAEVSPVRPDFDFPSARTHSFSWTRK